MLELKNLVFKVGDKTILNGLNYNFQPNNIYVITGANGSGKSTLAKIIMGLVRPKRGEIFLGSRNLNKFDVTKRANLGISLSFQQPVKFKGISVRELLEIARREKPINDILIKKIIIQVGLDPKNYLDREINDELSGGELKRIELATVLIRQPKIAIFDEPEAGIDLWSFDKLVKVFSKLRDKDRVVIVISHQEKILKLADKVLLLKDGNITEFDSYQQITGKVKNE
ncbi:MAG: ABC transporter ATP-binding protein [Candidatus Nanosyncoccaceae bacterium]|jgi:Fe-S cluster assembly ATP-binding protein